MASVSMSDKGIVGNAADFGLQGDGLSETPLAWRGLRLDTIVALRWLGVFGQTLALLVVGGVLGFREPLVWCALLVAAGAAVNLTVSLFGRRGRQVTNAEASLQLGFDIAQLVALLFLTGGVVNPFALLLIAPITLAASSLTWRHAAALAAFAAACALALALWSLPLPWPAGGSFEPLLVYRLGAAAAIISGIGFTAGYGWLAARQAGRMELALHVTQAVLAREQRLSALGGLAAAAAHELGSPPAPR